MYKVNVVNKYKDKETTNTVPIHRGGKYFGNPYKMEDYANDRNVVIDLFNRHFLEDLPYKYPHLHPLINLEGDLDLQCFCAPCPCHGDIIKEFILFARELKETSPGVHPVAPFRVKKGYQSLVKRDGVDHINIYSKGQTGLGRWLSNFTYSPFYHEKYGQFDSMEGFWYYVATGHKHEQLKTVHGYKAKVEGSSFKRVHNPNFEKEIREGIYEKLNCNNKIREDFLNSNLPLKHYYTYGLNAIDGTDEVIKHNPVNVLIKSLQEYRTEFTFSKPTVIAGSRSISDYSKVTKAIRESGMRISRIASGMAKGVDILGRHYGLEHGIPVDEYPVTKEEWKASKAAGIIRNGRMEKDVEQGIVLIENGSTGSLDMIKRLREAGKPVFVVEL